MLEQTLRELKNYFIKKVWYGTFTVSEGRLDLQGRIQEGQYFKIHGSVFNDGVYQYPATELHDEVYVGEVWCLAIPKPVLDAVAAKEAWLATNSDVLNSPFASESFGGYSYSKKGSASGNGVGGGGVTSGTIYDDTLRQWKKIRYDTDVIREEWR